MFRGLFQPMHLLLIAALALLLFGPKRIPEFGKVLGDGVRGIRGLFRFDSDDSETGTTTVRRSKALPSAKEDKHKR